MSVESMSLVNTSHPQHDNDYISKAIFGTGLIGGLAVICLQGISYALESPSLPRPDWLTVVVSTSLFSISLFAFWKTFTGKPREMAPLANVISGDSLRDPQSDLSEIATLINKIATLLNISYETSESKEALCGLLQQIYTLNESQNYPITTTTTTIENTSTPGRKGKISVASQVLRQELNKKEADIQILQEMNKLLTNQVRDGSNELYDCKDQIGALRCSVDFFRSQIQLIQIQLEEGEETGLSSKKVQEIQSIMIQILGDPSISESCSVSASNSAYPSPIGTSHMSYDKRLEVPKFELP